jgi:hypothetical protein
VAELAVAVDEARAVPDPVARLLDTVEGLSDEEVVRMLEDPGA